MVIEQTWRVLPRDAAFEALTVRTRDAYERETHRNNAELLPNSNCIRITKAILKGEEILATYGWDYYKERPMLLQAHATEGVR